MKSLNGALSIFTCLAMLSCGGGGDGGSSDSSGAFGPGTYIVGQDIGAGRFFSNPKDGCY